MKLFNAVLLAGAAQAGVGSRVIDMVRSNRYESLWSRFILDGWKKALSR